ncbi:MAG: carbohydrate ABC transporter permease [Oscillospiraceae bacterium]|nr:carbohydrate ABC transporter permease [Oscillospiraceae bacterium]
MEKQIVKHSSLVSLSKVLMTLLFVLITVIVMIPLYYLLLSSFTDTTRIFAAGLTLVPQLDSLGFFNYVTAFTARDGIYWSWYFNSIVITTMYTVGALFLTSMVGYAFGVYQFPGKNFLFIMVLIVMMIPFEILMLPLFSLMLRWNLLNTRLGVVLPFMVAGNAIFFFRQFSAGMPKELMDAGRIDGATEFGIYFKIMMPLMKPAFGAMTILLAMASWNMFLWPLIVLRSTANFTLTVGLASLLSPHFDNYAILLPGAVMAVIPVIILFLINQRSFVSGLASGSIKG